MSPTARSKSEERWQLEPIKSVRHGWIGQLQHTDGKLDMSLMGSQSGAPMLPNLGSMQRATTPWQYNTPIRIVELTKDAEESKSRSLRKLMDLKPPPPSSYIRRIRRKVQESSASPINSKTYVTDLSFIAESASRAGNLDSAAQAYHKMGVAYDNMGKLRQANSNYYQCLSLCVAAKNQQGEALACNSLGINNFKLGMHEAAIKYHTKHLELADPHGKLLAHTNLGLVYDEMNRHDTASTHHQQAIAYANRVNASDAQTMAVGNLGISALNLGDSETSRTCLQYHIQMAERNDDVNDSTQFTRLAQKSAENNAHHKLGEVSITDGNLEEAATHFALSVDLARKLKDQGMEQKSSVMLGVSQGLMHLDKYQKELLESSKKLTL